MEGVTPPPAAGLDVCLLTMSGSACDSTGKTVVQQLSLRSTSSLCFTRPTGYVMPHGLLPGTAAACVALPPSPQTCDR